MKALVVDITTSSDTHNDVRMTYTHNGIKVLILNYDLVNFFLLSVYS